VAVAIGPTGPKGYNDHTTSTRGRRLPIRRSDPGPITRAGVVSLWALRRPLAGASPWGRADDPDVPTSVWQARNRPATAM
jgi:hypothetical protein